MQEMQLTQNQTQTLPFLSVAEAFFACLHNFPESAPLTVVCLEATVPSISTKIYSISDSYYSY